VGVCDRGEKVGMSSEQGLGCTPEIVATEDDFDDLCRYSSSRGISPTFLLRTLGKETGDQNWLDRRLWLVWLVHEYRVEFNAELESDFPKSVIP